MGLPTTITSLFPFSKKLCNPEDDGRCELADENFPFGTTVVRIGYASSFKDDTKLSFCSPFGSNINKVFTPTESKSTTVPM